MQPTIVLLLLTVLAVGCGGDGVTPSSPSSMTYYLSRTGETIGPPPVGGCDSRGTAIGLLPNTIGYVKVGPCDCDGNAEIKRFAEALQQAIAAADRPELVGWIVDTRGNTATVPR